MLEKIVFDKNKLGKKIFAIKLLIKNYSKKSCSKCATKSVRQKILRQEKIFQNIFDTKYFSTK